MKTVFFCFSVVLVCQFCTFAVSFSDAFLVSHRIMQRQRMQKYSVLLLTRMVWRSSFVSSFWLSVILCLAMQLISEFIWLNLRWNGPTWQAKTTILYFAINSQWERLSETYFARPKHVIGIQRANESASQECLFATPTKKKPSQI